MNATRKLTDAIAQPRAMRAAKALRWLKDCGVEHRRQAYDAWLGLATAGEVRKHYRDWMGAFPQWAEHLTAKEEKMTLEKHLESGVSVSRYDMRLPCRRVVCKDGFSVSVQASSTHYCTPKSNLGPYTEVELGFPSEPVEAWMPYADNVDNPTGTIYGYVPIELVEEVLKKHGGIDWKQMEKE